MATDDISAMTQLSDITECCICLKTFTDPRMLPCIHTFCFQCLETMVDKSDKKPRDEINCPVCRKEFTIPFEGIQGLQKNFSMTQMIEVRNALNKSKVPDRPCDACQTTTDSTETSVNQAAFRCLDCEQNLCEACRLMHQAFKSMRNHKILKIGDGIGEEEDIRNLSKVKCCIHPEKVLDYYCAECEKVICVSCFVESHGTHKCKDITTVEEEFRQKIKASADKISSLAGELLAKKEKSESVENFLSNMTKREQEIMQRGEELKAMIEEHTASLLSSLDERKNRRLKVIHTEEDELEMHLTILESFSAYCYHLRSKGSAFDVCRNKDALLRRADELEEDHETYIMRPHKVVFNVSFMATDLTEFLKTINGNIIGSLNEIYGHLEHNAIVIGADDSYPNSYRVNLHRPNEVSTLGHSAPDVLMSFPVAAVYYNTFFITGFGESSKEIWRYDFTSGWKRRGSLVQGRHYHCATVIGETLYICGGRSENQVVLESIEAYNALTEETRVIGQLKFGTEYAACVAYKGSIYVYGGKDKDCKPLDCVQVFSPGEKICTFLSTPIPLPCGWPRVGVWDAFAILMDCNKCFIFNFEDKTWQESKMFDGGRQQCNYGMILYNNRLFEIYGMRCGDEYNVTCRYTRAANLLKNEALNWRPWGQLPQEVTVRATAQLSLLIHS